MAFEPIINEVASKHSRKLGAMQSYAEVKCETLAGEEVGSVLSVSSTPSVASMHITPSGVEAVLSVKSVVLAVAVTGEVLCVNAQSECLCKLSVSGLESEQKVFALPSLIEISNIKVDGGQISCSVLLESSFWCLATENIKYVSSVGEDAFSKTDIMKYSDVTACVVDGFEHVAEVDIPVSVSRVLSVDSVMSVSSVECSTDMVTISGQIISNVICLTSDERPKLKSQSYTQDFRHELLAGGSLAGATAIAEAYVCDATFEIAGELNSGKGMLIIKNKLSANVLVNEIKEVACVVDAYCTANQLTLTTESSNLHSLFGVRKFSDKVDGNIVLDESAARVEKVFCNAASFVVPVNIEAGQDTVSIEGVVYSNVLYLNDADEDNISSVQVEMPFATKLDYDGITTESEIEFSASVVEVDSRSKKGREIDVQAEVVFCVHARSATPNAVISSIALGESKTISEAALGVYMVSNCAEMWDVAKQLSVCPEQLSTQNPELTFPIIDPQNVVVYRQIKR